MWGCGRKGRNKKEAGEGRILNEGNIGEKARLEETRERGGRRKGV